MQPIARSLFCGYNPLEDTTRFLFFETCRIMKEEFPMAWNRWNLLDLNDWEPDDFHGFVDYALSLAPRLESLPKKPLDSLHGMTVANMFFENSTRTRNSFAAAEQMTGAAYIDWSASGSSMAKGETLRDTVWTLCEMGVNGLVVRHSLTGMPYYIQKLVPHIPVFNAGDGARSHPTQGLLDIVAATRRLGDLKGATVAIIGDVKYSRVARSDVLAFGGMGARVTVSGPRTLLPANPEAFGAKYVPDPRKAVAEADIVMLLRVQLERQEAGLFPSVKEYHELYGANEELLSHAKPGAVVMHPAPINRGVEISSALADGERSLLREQVHCGVLTRMAVLDICLGGGKR